MSVTGRFAPTPSGPLHFGSVVAAVGSFLSARAAGGRWLLRIDDVDKPRVVPGATKAILDELERLCLEWDDEYLLQSLRRDAHHAALAALADAGDTYPCACTRREVGADPYPGTCRDGLALGREGRSTRMRTVDANPHFDDRLRGPVRCDLERETGDFVVRRADGIVAYHLATVVDDAYQGVDEIVRGGDLLEVTARQVHLQRSLGLPTPSYAHLPIAVGADGAKLSKQTRAGPVANLPAGTVIGTALAFLGHAPPAELAGAPARELLAWALGAWDLARVPSQFEHPAPL